MIAELRRQFARLLKSSHARHAGTLLTGTMAAQVILLVSTPILSRLYTPEQFGYLGLLMQIGLIGGVAAPLGWQLIILNAASTRMALAGYHLCLVASLLSSLLLAGSALLLITLLPDWSITNQRWLDFLLILLMLLTSGAFYVIGFPLSRFNDFRNIAIAKFNLTALPTSFQILLGVAGFQAFGLLVGRVAGQIGAVAILALRGKVPEAFLVKNWRRMRLRRMQLAALRNFGLLYQLPRMLLMRLTSAAPSLLLLAFFGPVVAGLYFITERLIERPGLILGDVLSKLPQKNFAERVRNKRRVVRLILAYTAAAALAILPALGLLAWIAPVLFPILFGAVWAPAADYAIPVAINAGARLVAIPMLTMLAVLDLGRSALALEVILAVRLLVFPIVALNGGSALTALWIFVGLNVMYQMLNSGWALLSARRYERKIA